MLPRDSDVDDGSARFWLSGRVDCSTGVLDGEMRGYYTEEDPLTGTTTRVYYRGEIGGLFDPEEQTFVNTAYKIVEPPTLLGDVPGGEGRGRRSPPMERLPRGRSPLSRSVWATSTRTTTCSARSRSNRFSVHNRGQAIPEEDRTQLVEAFRRSDAQSGATDLTVSDLRVQAADDSLVVTVGSKSRTLDLGGTPSGVVSITGDHPQAL